MEKYTDEEIRKLSKITCKIASEYLGISPMAVSIGMRNNLLPIGFAIHNEEEAPKSFRNYSIPPPFLTGVISNEALPHVHRILDTLYCQIEILGRAFNDDFSLTIRNERVTLKIFEGQDEVRHKLTREEAQELVAYEDKIRHDRWASKPNIRKYDYIFNGKLKVSILNNEYFRDFEKVKIESRFGDMLIDLYDEEPEVIRKKR